jgi:N-dimethylarginine dimethylaminohydrolase
LSFADINSAKSLIKELLTTTSNHYKIAFEQIKELGEFMEKSNLSIELVLLASQAKISANKNVAQDRRLAYMTLKR